MDSATSRDGRRAAIVVGINDYGDRAGLDPLKSAEADAGLIARCFNGLGYDVHMLLGGNATFRALHDLIAGTFRGRSFDQFVFYFAGHGEQMSRSGEHVLHLAKTSGHADESPGSHRLADAIAEHVRTRHVVMILDACRNDFARTVGIRGATAGLGEGVAESWRGVGARGPSSGSPDGEGPFFHTLLSCSPGQYSQEDPEWKHGIFTWTLVKTIDEHGAHYPVDVLTRFVGERTIERCRSHKKYRPQHPQWIATNVGERIYFNALSPLEQSRLTEADLAREHALAEARQRLDDALRRGDTARAIAASAEALALIVDPFDLREMRARHEALVNGTPATAPIDANGLQTSVHRGVTYVRVPAGEFDMGRSGSTHRVRIDEPFWISDGAITVEAFRQFKPLHASQYPDHPALVSWHQAAAYCFAVGGQLPTEAEWEYAARGGLAGCDFPWQGRIDNRLINHAGRGTWPAREALPNGFGLMHVCGNVWEWCADAFTPGLAPRALRGGSWREMALTSCTVWSRKARRPEQGADDIGFRCVLPEVGADVLEATARLRRWRS